MNIPQIVLCIAVALLAGQWKISATEMEPPSGLTQKWKLVWSDEFDKPGKPDPAKWDYEYQGFVRNREMQWYTDSSDNVYIKDGFLHLVALPVDKPNPWYKEGSDNWKFNRKRITITSAGLVTRKKFTFRYGIVKMRAKLPEGQGVWPAFWTGGTDFSRGRWPASGEIDIFEFCRNKLGIDQLSAAVHWKDKNGRHRQANKKISGRKFTDDFHIFSLEWTPEKLVFSFDDEPFFTFRTELCSDGDFNAFRAPHFLLVNLAIGGILGGKVDPDIFPAEYLIDYIRIYQKK